MGIIWDGERRAAEKLAGLFSSCHFQAKVVCCGVKMTQKWSLNGAANGSIPHRGERRGKISNGQQI